MVINIKKLGLISTISFLNHASVIAQQVFPSFQENPTWYVTQIMLGVGGVSTATHICNYSQELTICGYTYSKANITNYSSWVDMYIRTDSLKTYYRTTNTCADREYILCDYSLNEGEYFTSYNQIGLFDSTIYQLYLIDSVTSLGIERQRYTFLYQSGYFTNDTIRFIKGIGSTIHPFYPFVCSSDACEQSFSLSCFYSDSVQLYGSVGNCIVTQIGFEENSSKDSKLYPNPTSTTLRITNNSDFATLTDLTGKILITIPIKSSQTDVDISSLLNGVYFLKTREGQTSKVVVQH